VADAVSGLCGLDPDLVGGSSARTLYFSRVGSSRASRIRKRMVRETGVEPARPFGHKILSLARLPVPPLPHFRINSLRTGY
jgi:hypothetical protein